MKKVLAIVLAIVMAFSVCGVAVSAITVDQLPVMPEAKEGMLYFAADNAFVRKGDTVDIPVYLIADYNTACTNGFVELGFRFTATGAPCTVNSVSFANDVKAVKGFKEFRCFYGDPGEDYFPDPFETGFEPLYTDWDFGYVAFAAGLDILKAGKIQIATINLTVGDEFNKDYDETDVNADSEFIAIELSDYNFGDTFVGCWFNAAGAVIEGELTDDVFYGNYAANTVDSEDYMDGDMIITDLFNLVDEKGEGQISVSNGVLMGNPPKEKWSNKLIDWLENSIKQIYEKIDIIRDFILTIVGALRKI